MRKLYSGAYCTIRMLACVVWLAAPVVADDTNQPYVDSPPYKSKVLDQLEAKPDSIHSDSLARMAPTLAELLERQEPTLDWRVLQLLTKADLTKCSEPRQLVESVSRLLDDPEQATRALAVDVLCNIGATAIAATTTRLKSPSPRVRACSTVVLIRLGELSETDAIEISHDTDARVRVATIAALGKTQAGTNVLIGMLFDEETAVACRAAEQLGRLPEKQEPEVIVRALANALTRPEVSFFAARSLARMGTDARSAIPKLLAAFPVGGTNLIFSGDMVEMALARIGEPLEEDITEIVSLTEQENAESRILVCQELARFGIKAKSASVLLEKMMRFDLAREMKQSKELEQSEELEPGSDQRQRFVIAAKAALSAYWFTTRDALAFRSLAEEWTDELWLGHDFWSSLSGSDKTELISCCLQSSSAAVVAEAVNAIANTLPMAVPEPKLQTMLETMMQANEFEDREILARAWLNTLTPAQPNVEDRVLAALERNSISIEQFAQNAQRLNCGGQRSGRILLEGAKKLEKFPAQYCGEAYLQLATNRVQAVEDMRQQKTSDANGWLE